ncbi:hypothetical protein PFISCL1PPCAC_13606, partial [Pristionchus fissidentatus]
ETCICSVAAFIVVRVDLVRRLYTPPVSSTQSSIERLHALNRRHRCWFGVVTRRLGEDRFGLRVDECHNRHSFSPWHVLMGIEPQCGFQS